MNIDFNLSSLQYDTDPNPIKAIDPRKAEAQQPQFTCMNRSFHINKHKQTHLPQQQFDIWESCCHRRRHDNPLSLARNCGR